MANIISIDSGGKLPDPTTPQPPTATNAKKYRFVLNQHTRRQFILLTLGALDYPMKKAAAVSGHDLRDGEEQIKALARKQVQREMAMRKAA
jgi:hypothetical protein